MSLAVNQIMSLNVYEAQLFNNCSSKKYHLEATEVLMNLKGMFSSCAKMLRRTTSRGRSSTKTPLCFSRSSPMPEKDSKGEELLEWELRKAANR